MSDFAVCKTLSHLTYSEVKPLKLCYSQLGLTLHQEFCGPLLWALVNHFLTSVFREDTENRRREREINLYQQVISSKCMFKSLIKQSIPFPKSVLRFRELYLKHKLRPFLQVVGCKLPIRCKDSRLGELLLFISESSLVLPLGLPNPKVMATRNLISWRKQMHSTNLMKLFPVVGQASLYHLIENKCLINEAYNYVPDS